MDTWYIFIVLRSEILTIFPSTKILIYLGPSLPAYDIPFTSGHQMVSNGNNLFYINTVDNVILQLTCTNLLEDCQWNIIASKLEIPRQSAFVTLIPDHLTLCSISSTPVTTSSSTVISTTTMSSSLGTTQSTTTYSKSLMKISF